LILVFIEEQRTKGRSVGSICRVLREQGVPVAERTYRSWKRAQPSDRDLADAVVIDAIRAVRVNAKGEATPESMYGRRKMTALLRRQGLAVSKRQVDRLMRELGINGLVRGKGVRTTVPDRNAARAPDLLDRDFTAAAPNRRWVADFTYVRTWAGFVYVSFVIDCYSRAIVGWHAATVKTTPLVTTALRMGLWRRDRAGHPAVDGLVHHSDAGSQFTSVSFAETLALEASPRRSGRSATRTTTPSPNPPSAYSRTRRSETAPRFAPGRCAPSTTSSGSPLAGSTGTTRGACTRPSETSRPTSPRLRTTLTSKRHPTRCWHPHRSGTKPGTVHLPVSRGGARGDLDGRGLGGRR
jgi:putative transposase